ncbi:DUF2207 domain-containing protein [Halobacillus rhizosphaerae]|uniref:DUF2207 domain-containing protein n=1 Tax=Halobacillus rhizosphaerae TaxID=3064889 RepID=UPI00398A8C78
MKKWIIMLIAVLMAGLFPIHSLAVEFNINQTHMDAYLQKNGEVQVDEVYTYDFDGEFHGITRTIIPKKGSSISNVEASENGKPLEVKQEDHTYKVYRAGKDETITIELSYVIHEGMEFYSDAAQFYWPFFDSGNETTYHHLTIGVHPPVASSPLAAVGYDEAYGTEKIVNDGSVLFKLGTVPAGENGDIRVAYDPALFSPGTLKNGTILNNFHADKEKMEQKMARDHHRHELLQTFSPYLLGFFVLCLVLLVIHAVKKKNETARDSERVEWKDEMSLPATLAFVKNGRISTDILTAALLDLVRKGYIEKKEDESFRVIHQETDYHHESTLIEWLFYEIGTEGTFTPEHLKSYVKNKKNHSTYQTDFSRWRSAVNEEVKENHLYQNGIKVRWAAVLLAFALIPLAVVYPIYNLPIAMIVTIILIALFVLFAIVYRPKSARGVAVLRDWKEGSQEENFKQFILDLGSGLYEGLPRDNHPMNQDVAVLILLAVTFQDGFQDANQTVYAANSAGTGSSGVGGGGGGSGAF